MAVAIVLIMIGAAFVLTDGFQPAAKNTVVVLVPDQSYYSIPGGQFNAVAFVAHSSSVINGTFSNTLGVTVYVLTPSQLFNLSRTGAVSSYQWSSGLVANLTVDSVDVSVAAGEWYLTFVNPSLLNTTTIGFYTAITVAPG